MAGEGGGSGSSHTRPVVAHVFPPRREPGMSLPLCLECPQALLSCKTCNPAALPRTPASSSWPVCAQMGLDRRRPPPPCAPGCTQGGWPVHTHVFAYSLTRAQGRFVTQHKGGGRICHMRGGGGSGWCCTRGTGLELSCPLPKNPGEKESKERKKPTEKQK